MIGVPQVSTATWTDDQCRWIGEQVVAPQARWLASIGRPVNLNQVRYHPNTSGSASENWSGRMGEAEWDSFNGLCAHIDVPYNDHWDCSAERLDRIAAYAIAALGGQSLGPASDDDLWRFLMNNDELTKKINDIWGTTATTRVELGQHVGGIYTRIDQAEDTIQADMGTHVKGVYTRIEQLEDHGDVHWSGGGGDGGAGEPVSVEQALATATPAQLVAELNARLGK